MKIFYLSTAAYSDNQTSILRSLSQIHTIIYAVVIPYTNSNYTKTELEEFCEDHSIEFLPYMLKHRYRDPRVIPAYLEIIKTIRNARPDIIYVANFDQLYLNLLLLLVDRSKTIIALHDVESHSKVAFGKLVQISRKVLIAGFHHFHTFSSIQQETLQKKVPGKSVYKISLPLIDFGDLTPKPVREKTTRFLFFGNILYYKGLDLLLEAFKSPSLKRENIELIIAGRCNDWEDVYFPLIQNDARIKYDIRFIENDEIAAFFSLADFVILPYRDTTQSGPLMIAYNYNIPVVVSRAEGFAEFTFEDVTGYSFDLYKEDDIARVISHCASISCQEYEALKIRLAGYVEQHFSFDAITAMYDKMFKTVQSGE